jgi:hypothetical protein
MTDSITPPPELVQQLYGLPQLRAIEKAYQAGADQELEACCEWLKDFPHFIGIEEQLRAARRPKPPTLKEQAMALLDMAEDPSWDINDFSIVRRALEALPE